MRRRRTEGDRKRQKDIELDDREAHKCGHALYLIKLLGKNMFILSE